jgi:hypothetical protein
MNLLAVELDHSRLYPKAFALYLQAANEAYPKHRTPAAHDPCSEKRSCRPEWSCNERTETRERTWAPRHLKCFAAVAVAAAVGLMVDFASLAEDPRESAGEIATTAADAQAPGTAKTRLRCPRRS